MNRAIPALASLACVSFASLAGAGGVASPSGDLFATQADIDDVFGSTLALGGDTVVVGAPSDDAAGVDSGAVYVYSFPSRAFLFELVPDAAGPNLAFGSAVSAFGDRAIVGVPTERAAYVFDLDTGQQLHRFSPFGAAVQTGHAVAINDAYALVGSPFDSEADVDAGAVYVYDVVSGALLRKLTPGSTGPGDALGHEDEEFGSAVALHGSRAVIGAPSDRALEDGQPLNNAGSVYEFDLDSGLQVRKIEPQDRDDGVFFGSAVAINADTVVVGSPRDSEFAITAGAAYVFDAATGAQLHKLLPETLGFTIRDIGRAVAVNDDFVLAGAPRTQFQAETNVGALLLFDVATGEELDFIAEFGAEGDSFGASVAMNSGVLAAGAPGNDEATTNAGVVRFYSFAPADLNGDGCVGSIDLAVLLAAWGSPGDADIDGDGAAGASDLAILLAAWGCG